VATERKALQHQLQQPFQHDTTPEPIMYHRYIFQDLDLIKEGNIPFLNIFPSEQKL
jgi:hypothetical protein